MLVTGRLVRCVHVGVRAACQQATAIRLDAIRREISSGGSIAPVGRMSIAGMRWISTVHVPSQLRLFSSSANGSANLPSDPRTWTEQQVQQWFEAHKDGKWAQHANKFVELTGEEFCDMTKEDFILFVGDPIGAVVFNDVQKLVKQDESAVSYDIHAQQVEVPTTVEDVQFTINGAIGRQKRSSFFFVDPADSNEAVLLPAVRAGKFVMLHGPRASGKSTRMFRACEQLSSEFYVMNVTLQDGIQTTSPDAFWTSMANKLRRVWRQIPHAHNGDEFSGIFDPANQDMLFEGKRVVLFIDEFDLLEHADVNVHDEVLHVFRGLKQNSDYTCLHSVVAVGPFSILQLNTQRTGSPFNVSDAVAVELFDESQVEDLFSQLATARHAMIDRHIAADVFDRTDGHPGLVGFCGKMLDERLLRQSPNNNVDLGQWEAWTTESMVTALTRWSTMEKMVNVITSPSTSQIKDARHLLIRRFLPHPGDVPISVTELPLARFLVAEGALREGRGDHSFAVRNDVVRSVLLARVVPLDRRQPPATPFPLERDGINVITLLKTAVGSFSPAVIAGAAKNSYKRASDGRPVPHEYAYHFELVSVLQSWVPSDVRVLAEVKESWSEVNRSISKKRADIFVEPDERKHSVILELVANSNEKDVLEHCEKSVDYRDRLKAGKVYVVHFVSKWPPSDHPPGHGADHQVPIATVYHDEAFDHVDIVWSHPPHDDL